MRLSTRARYGLRICFMLGLGSGIIPLSSLAKQTNLSEKYIGQLMAMLKRAGIADATRGAAGGYRLTRPPESITIDEILTALDDNFDISDCAMGGCDDQYCPNRTLFSRLHSDIKNVLTGTTLSDLIADSSCESNKKKFAKTT